MASSRTWYRENYMISTAPQLIQPEAINAAFESDALYWARSMELGTLKRMLAKSLCFGIYLLPESSSEVAGRHNPPQIGFARLITDEVTIAYLSDVYVLKEHQGKGLGSWLMECVNEELDTWPDLRRVMLIANLEEGEAFYGKKLGMTIFEQGENGFAILNKKGKGSTMTV